MESWSRMFDGPGKMKVRVESVRVFCSGAHPPTHPNAPRVPTHAPSAPESAAPR